MAKLPIEKVHSWVMKQLPSLREGECLDLLCKKRNRLIRIIKISKEFRIEERGFFQEDHQVKNIKEFEKLFSRLIAREFPRSHILWAFKRRS